VVPEQDKKGLRKEQWHGNFLPPCWMCDNMKLVRKSDNK
jgi:hypothetical protein